MEIINPDKISFCDTKVVDAFHDIVAYIEKEFGIHKVTVTSGARPDKVNVKSWHDKAHGYKAIDFTLEVNLFELVSKVYHYIKFWNMGVTEFELVRGRGKQHFHIACGNENELETFTGVYPKEG